MHRGSVLLSLRRERHRPRHRGAWEKEMARNGGGKGRPCETLPRGFCLPGVGQDSSCAPPSISYDSQHISFGVFTRPSHGESCCALFTARGSGGSGVPDRSKNSSSIVRRWAYNEFFFAVFFAVADSVPKRNTPKKIQTCPLAGRAG